MAYEKINRLEYENCTYIIFVFMQFLTKIKIFKINLTFVKL